MKYLIFLVILFGLVAISFFSPVYGQSIPSWLDPGTDDGRFDYPGKVAFDSLGNLYAVDAGNFRIQKFNSDGKFLLKWGSEGKNDGQFKCPGGLAIDSSDRIYVADSCKQQIQIFDDEGGFITKWGNPGSGNQNLLAPLQILIDSNQNVYVIDDSRSSIQRFTNDGEFISIWKTDNVDVCRQYGVTEKFEPCKIGINGIAMDSNGNFFIIKRLNQSLEKISSQGTILAKWVLVDNEYNQPLYPQDIVIDRSGDLYITAGGTQAFLYKYSNDGQFISKWLRKDISNSFFTNGIALDSFENLYISVGSEYGSFGRNNVIEKYTNQGKLISKIGQPIFNNTSFSSYPPAKQLRIGVPQDLIVCKQDLVLVLEHHYKPVCVKSKSILKLVERGWIVNTSIDGGIPRECYLKPDPGVCNTKTTKYYFDWESQSCKSFSWNGCRGTVPFDFFESCASLCSQ